MKGFKYKKDEKYLEKVRERNTQINEFEDIDSKGFVFSLFFLLFLFGFLMFLLLNSIFRLQVLEGESMLARSQRNQIHLINIHPRRGVVFDRNGEKLVENISVVDLFLSLQPYIVDGELDRDALKEDILILEEVLEDNWISGANDEEYGSISERIFVLLEIDSGIERIKISSDVSNEVSILLKSLKEDLPSIYLEEGYARNYIFDKYFAHILGYTSIATAEDLETYEYIGFNDIVGRSGIERYYNDILFGQKGQVAIEVDVLGRVVSENELLVKEAISGESLNLSLDLEAQKKAYSILESGVERFGAQSGAMVVQDVKSGEILVMSNYPSYDNNLFIGGISQEDFEGLLYAKGSPLTNKAIAAQVPPGSTFKTLVAAAALDAGKVKKETIYESRRGYTFSTGAPFQEFRNNEYGKLNLTEALMLSSNIYFCEIIRNWDIQELVPYLEDFGIGQYTGIDIPGEGAGRLPSPENKVALANSSSPWLEPYWLPEGDSCNAVIGQGIVTTTPIQVVNWTSAIANGGTLHTPHIAVSRVDSNGKVIAFDIDPKNTDFISDSALEIVREGMRDSVSGSRRVILPLDGAKISIAAKTGTAEFGRLSADGKYEHTHAWVSGFFPFENPKYSFVVFLEDGGESNNSAQLAREFIDWFDF